MLLRLLQEDIRVQKELRHRASNASHPLMSGSPEQTLAFCYPTPGRTAFRLFFKKKTFNNLRAASTLQSYRRVEGYKSNSIQMSGQANLFSSFLILPGLFSDIIMCLCDYKHKMRLSTGGVKCNQGIYAASELDVALGNNLSDCSRRHLKFS